MLPAIDEVVIAVLHLAAYLNCVLIDFKKSGAVTKQTNQLGERVCVLDTVFVLLQLLKDLGVNHVDQV